MVQKEDGCTFAKTPQKVLKKMVKYVTCNVFIYIAPFDLNTCSKAFSHQSGLNIYHGGEMANGGKKSILFNQFKLTLFLVEQLYSILQACFPLMLVGVTPLRGSI